MEREKRIPVNFEEALLASSAGVIIGAGVGSALFLDYPVIEGVKLALTGLPVALIGANKRKIRINYEKGRPEIEGNG